MRLGATSGGGRNPRKGRSTVMRLPGRVAARIAPGGGVWSSAAVRATREIEGSDAVQRPLREVVLRERSEGAVRRSRLGTARGSRSRFLQRGAPPLQGGRRSRR